MYRHPGSWPPFSTPKGRHKVVCAPAVEETDVVHRSSRFGTTGRHRFRRESLTPRPAGPPPNVRLLTTPPYDSCAQPASSFSLKHHSTTRSVDLTPLPPCLVHRPQPSGPSSPLLHRHARTPRKPSPSPPRSDIITVPLRPCCAACQSVTEAALVHGDAWQEHFSRAASRQRSQSVDGSPRTMTVAGSAASASYGSLGVSISVDEVDKRRRSSDTGPSTTTLETLWSNHPKVREECRVHSFAPDAPLPATPRIPEEEDDEDENELFPLPSPKRTPTTSPAPSLAGSLSSLMVAQPTQTSGASPTPSTCSGDSAVPPPNKRHFLAPPPCSSSSSLSLPKLSESTTDLSEDTPRAPSPHLLSALPSLSARHRSRSPSPRLSFIPPTPTDASPSTADSIPQPFEPIPIPVPIPLSPPSQPSSSPRHSPTQTRFPWRSKRSVSDIGTPASPSTSPTLSTTSTKKSISSPLQMFADVLRGVGAMGSGSGGLAPGV